MTEFFKQQIRNVRAEFEKNKSETTGIREILSDQIEKLSQALLPYKKSFCGNWGKSFNVYRRNFNQYTNEVMTIDKEYIKAELKSKSKTGIDLDNVRKIIPEISKSFFKLQDFILSEISFIGDIEGFSREAELLTKIENFQWGRKPGEYITSKQPKPTTLADQVFFSRGFSVPPHIEIKDEIWFTFCLLNSYDDFEKLANRFLRNLEIRSSTNFVEEANAVFKQHALKLIIEKFHLFASQIKNRYNDRHTVSMDDEYDVQDLMNALLHIYFEDVRKEEYTPSYAGSSTRIDFLLKREKILIEVKKTRSNLKDKEIGNQLINDIAHYKSHPDCKHLICFVYDPDKLIVNPRGLEDDLNKNTTEDMTVEVYVKP